MVEWIDTQLAVCVCDSVGVPARDVRDLHLRDALDSVSFQAVRETGAVVLTKDADFVTLRTAGEPLVEISARAISPALAQTIER